VELRHRVRFHDHRFVADDALALSDISGRMNSFLDCPVTAPATLRPPNHTRVIYPHC
jgi:hypothetical protein